MTQQVLWLIFWVSIFAALIVWGLIRAGSAQDKRDTEDYLNNRKDDHD